MDWYATTGVDWLNCIFAVDLKTVMHCRKSSAEHHKCKRGNNWTAKENVSQWHSDDKRIESDGKRIELGKIPFQQLRTQSRTPEAVHRNFWATFKHQNFRFQDVRAPAKQQRRWYKTYEKIGTNKSMVSTILIRLCRNYSVKRFAAVRTLYWVFGTSGVWTDGKSKPQTSRTPTFPPISRKTAQQAQQLARFRRTRHVLTGESCKCLMCSILI